MLHGVGWNAQTFIEYMLECGLDDKFLAPFENTRFVFPEAPIKPVQLYNNKRKPAWFNVYGLEN